MEITIDLNIIWEDLGSPEYFCGSKPDAFIVHFHTSHLVWNCHDLSIGFYGESRLVALNSLCPLFSLWLSSPPPMGL